MNNKNYNTENTNKQTSSPRAPFNHFTRKERLFLEDYLRRNDYFNEGKLSLSKIASVMRKSKSAISREIKRGTYRSHSSSGKAIVEYLADYAEGDARKKKVRSHYKTKLNKRSPCIKKLTRLINGGCSLLTAMIIYKEKTNHNFPVCERTLYYYSKKRIIPKTKNYKHIEKNEKEQKMRQKGPNIIERPFLPEDRSEFGHWEGDLIVGAKGKSGECLLTLIERKTRSYIAKKIPDKKRESVVRALDEIESEISPYNFRLLFKSITFDNGVEFRDYQNMIRSPITNELRTEIYYANPYHSWERGSNERGNRMMRKYFPKGTDFSLVSDRQILLATNRINYTVRKILNYSTAAEQLEKESESYHSLIKLGLQNPYTKITNRVFGLSI